MRKYVLLSLLVVTVALSACASAESTSWTATATTSRPLATQVPLTFTPVPTPESYVIVDVVMNVRNGPGTEFDVIGQIESQKKYSVIGKHVDWWLVDLANNQSGWVYAPVNVTRFVGNAEAVPDIVSPSTPTPIVIAACTPANSIDTPSAGMEQARSTLVSFFELLNHREYEKAAGLY